jgi:hypothetical protein
MSYPYTKEEIRLLNEKLAGLDVSVTDPGHSQGFTVANPRRIFGGDLANQQAPSPLQQAQSVSLGQLLNDEYMKEVAEIQEQFAQQERNRLWNLVVMAARGS